MAREPVLRNLASCTAMANLFGTIFNALQIIFMVRVLDIQPGYAGPMVAAVGVGAAQASAAAGALGRRIGTARLVRVSMLALGFAGMLVPAAGPGWRLALLPIGLCSIGMRIVLLPAARACRRLAVQCLQRSPVRKGAG